MYTEQGIAPALFDFFPPVPGLLLGEIRYLSVNSGVFCLSKSFLYICIVEVGGTTLGKSPSIISPQNPFGEMGAP